MQMSFEIVLDGGLEMRPMILVRIWLDLGTEMSDPMHRLLYEDEFSFAELGLTKSCEQLR
jgi:hypothetical protein